MRNNSFSSISLVNLDFKYFRGVGLLKRDEMLSPWACGGGSGSATSSFQMESNPGILGTVRRVLDQSDTSHADVESALDATRECPPPLHHREPVLSPSQWPLSLSSLLSIAPGKSSPLSP